MNRSNCDRTILQVDCPIPTCCSCWGLAAGAATPPVIEECELSNTPRETALGEQQRRTEETMRQANIHTFAARSISRMSLEDERHAMQTVQLALAEIRKDVSSLQAVQMRSTSYLKFLTDSVKALSASDVNQQLTLLNSRQQALEKQQEAVKAQHEKLKIDAESFEATMTSKLAELQTRMFHEVNESSQGLCSETSTAVSERLQSLEESMLIMKKKTVALGQQVSLLTDFVPRESQTKLPGAVNASQGEHDTNKQRTADSPGSAGTSVQWSHQLHGGLLPLQVYNPTSWNC